MKISERLKKYRLSAHLSQEDVAKRVGCKQSAVAQYESGKRTPNVQTLVKLAEIYGCTVNDFIY